jgi:hypothetical protein
MPTDRQGRQATAPDRPKAEQGNERSVPLRTSWRTQRDPRPSASRFQWPAG